MARLCWRGGLAAFLFILAGSAIAAPRLERERCSFKPPRGDRVECFVLIVPENREQPEGREVRLKVAVLKAKRTAGAEPMVYLSGGPGDAPLVASSPGADALSEGDWWNETANIRRKRDVIIMSQRGAGGATPNLDCFDPRTSEPAKARHDLGRAISSHAAPWLARPRAPVAPYGLVSPKRLTKNVNRVRC